MSPTSPSILTDDFVLKMDQNKGIIFKVANAYTNGLEAQKDLAQEITLQLWTSYPKYNAAYKFSTWMYRVALNVGISHYRKDLVRKKHLSETDITLVTVAADDSSGQSEESKLLTEFIHQLEPLNRAMMLLYLDEKSYIEIAEVLNITPSNVGTRISRIKQQLKEQFKQYYDERT